MSNLWVGLFIWASLMFMSVLLIGGPWIDARLRDSAPMPIPECIAKGGQPHKGLCFIYVVPPPPHAPVQQQSVPAI